MLVVILLVSFDVALVQDHKMTQMMDFFDLPAAYAVSSVINVSNGQIYSLFNIVVYFYASTLLLLPRSTLRNLEFTINRNAFIQMLRFVWAN